MFEKEHTIFENYTYDGLWFLIDQHKFPIRGQIKYVDNNIQLTLYDSSLDQKHKKYIDVLSINDDEIIPAIFGITNDGKKITLEQLFMQSFHTMGADYNMENEHSTANTPTLQKQSSDIKHYHMKKKTYNVRTMYVGAHIKNPYDKMIVMNKKSYSSLEEWIYDSKIKTDDDFETKEYTIIAKGISERKGRINDKFEYILEQIVDNPGHSQHTTDVCIKQRAYLILRSDVKQPYDEFELIHTRLKNLLTLFIGQNIKPIYTIIQQPAKFSETYVYNSTIDVTLKHKLINNHNMFITLFDISDNLTNIFQKWVQVYGELEMSFGKFFENMINTSLYPQDIFENLIQALESYHDKSLKGFNKIMDENNIEKFEMIKPYIYDHLNDNDKNWFADLVKSNTSHTASLLEKLCHLFLLFPYLCSCDNMISISQKIRDVRNNLVHNKNNVKEYDIIYLNDILELLMTSCILSELNFDENELKKFVLKYAFIKSKHKIIGVPRPFDSFWLEVNKTV